MLKAGFDNPFWWTGEHVGRSHEDQTPVVRDAPASGDLTKVTSDLTAGVLVVRGTQQDDSIRITTKGGNIKIKGLFPIADVKKIVVAGDAGNDTIRVASSISTKTFLYGNQGVDDISGGGGADQIFGGPNDDVLTGNAGADSLYGGQGNDTVNGDGGDRQNEQGSPNRTGSHDSVEQEIVDLTNQERADEMLPALDVDPQLIKAAQIQAKNMAKRFKQTGNLNLAVDHNMWAVAQPTLLTRIDFVGFEWTFIAENVAGGHNSAQDVVDAWMNSSGHRANILSTNTDLIGVGAASANGTTFHVQVFGNSV